MMRDAAAGMVNGCGSLSALAHNEMDQLEERFRHFRQSADLSRPIVHLSIDIDGKVGAPYRTNQMAPDSLQIRGLRSGPGRSDQKIPSIMEEQRIEYRVIPGLGKFLDPDIGRHILPFSGKIQRSAAVIRRVFGQMTLEKIRCGIL